MLPHVVQVDAEKKQPLKRMDSAAYFASGAGQQTEVWHCGVRPKVSKGVFLNFSCGTGNLVTDGQDTIPDLSCTEINSPRKTCFRNTNVSGHSTLVFPPKFGKVSFRAKNKVNKRFKF